MKFGYSEDWEIVDRQDNGLSPIRSPKNVKPTPDAFLRAKENSDKIRQCDAIYRSTKRRSPLAPKHQMLLDELEQKVEKQLELQKARIEATLADLSPVTRKVQEELISRTFHDWIVGDDVERDKFKKQLQSEAQAMNSAEQKSIEDAIKSIEEKERKEREVAEAQKRQEEERMREAQKAKQEAEQKAVKEREEAEKRKAQEQQAAAEQAKKVQEAADKARKDAEDKQKAAATASNQFMPKEEVDEAKARVEKINRIKSDLKPKLGTNPTLMQAVFKAKMTITQRIGQIMNSEQKIIELARVLDGVLKDANAASSEVYTLCMDLLAKRIVKQAESEIAVKTDTAFPLAILCIMLFREHKEFLDILLGRLTKRCPYIVPIYPPRLQSDTDDEFRKRLGYRKVNDAWETEIQFAERMCGILALYAAIVQTKTIPNPYGVENAWKWLARTVNSKPRRITPQLMLKFLEIAGHEFLKEYKKQAEKLFVFIRDQYIPMMPPKAVAATTRLNLFLEPIFKNGTIRPPPGAKLGV